MILLLQAISVILEMFFIALHLFILFKAGKWHDKKEKGLYKPRAWKIIIWLRKSKK